MVSLSCRVGGRHHAGRSRRCWDTIPGIKYSETGAIEQHPVAAGRTEFDGVLEDPAAFPPYTADLIWAEPLLYTPDRAYKRITGEEWGRDTRCSYESYSNTQGWAD